MHSILNFYLKGILQQDCNLILWCGAISTRFDSVAVLKQILKSKSHWKQDGTTLDFQLQIDVRQGKMPMGGKYEKQVPVDHIITTKYHTAPATSSDLCAEETYSVTISFFSFNFKLRDDATPIIYHFHSSYSCNLWQHDFLRFLSTGLQICQRGGKEKAKAK